MFTKDIIKKHITSDDIINVILHNGVVFLKEAIKIIAFLIFSFGIYWLIKQYLPGNNLSWWFAGVGCVLFLYFFIQFLDSYLDCLVLSKGGITFFAWDGLFRFKTDFFAWEGIEMVSYTQDSIWDKLMGKGDLLIRLEHGIELPFLNVSNPKKRAKTILSLREQHAILREIAPKAHNQDEFSIITEALSEVVKEYLEKKQGHEPDAFGL